MKRYEVTAHLVTARVDPSSAQGGLVYVYRGGWLPEGTAQESIDHLLSLGMIRLVDAPGAAQ